MNSKKATSRWVKLAAIAFLMLFAVPVLFLGGGSSQGGEELITGLADPQALVDRYREWEVEYERTGGDRNLVMELRWSKGLSDKHSKAVGYTKLDLVAGTVAAEVSGLPQDQGWELWLVQDNPGPGRTVLPEQGDTMIRIGALEHQGTMARLESEMGAETFSDFRPDFAIVTEENKAPDESRFLVGTTSLFHSLYRSAKRGQFGVIEDEAKAGKERGWLARLIDAIAPSAEAQNEAVAVTGLIAQGRKIFFNEQFQGNGRTCGTCHREEHNLTIDQFFIAGIQDPFDPLFVAEFNPVLAELENPPLMHKLGLILENLDGFDKPGVMRGVPHTLALPTSLRPAPPDSPFGTPGFANATGWSGDGAPTGEQFTILIGDGTKDTVRFLTTGSLRDFAIGAVRQHFPKRLDRVIGVDFRLPTLVELNALEAFQLSTGRQQDLSLPLSLKDTNAIAGQNLFLAVGCNGCHANAGANVSSDPSFNFNFNFDTDIENIAPGPGIDPSIPVDGGFGGTPCQGSSQPCGNGKFNTPPVVEAADTGPFFHNNAVTTTRIEDAVAFYATQTFANSPDGFPIPINQQQINQIGSFLRVINARENIIQAVGLERRAIQFASLAAAADLLNLSVHELQDAITVLVNGNLHPVARARLFEAVALDQQAAVTQDQTQRNALIQQAICKKQAARSDLENVAFPCIAPGP